MCIIVTCIYNFDCRSVLYLYIKPIMCRYTKMNLSFVDANRPWHKKVRVRMKWAKHN